MSARDIKVGDIVMCYGVNPGKVVHKFLSETGEEVYDIKLAYGSLRVAALRRGHCDLSRTKGNRFFTLTRCTSYKW
jgi:hypothetical protein